MKLSFNCHRCVSRARWPRRAVFTFRTRLVRHMISLRQHILQMWPIFSLNCYLHIAEMLRKETPRLVSESELYRTSDRRLSATLVPTSADKGCYVVSVTDPCGRILGFLDRRNVATVWKMFTPWITCFKIYWELRGLSPRTNNTDRATAACLRS
jgi:hypothetical protein